MRQTLRPSEDDREGAREEGRKCERKLRAVCSPRQHFTGRAKFKGTIANRIGCKAILPIGWPAHVLLPALFS